MPVRTLRKRNNTNYEHFCEVQIFLSLLGGIDENSFIGKSHFPRISGWLQGPYRIQSREQSNENRW